VYFQPGYEVYVTPVRATEVNVAVLLGAAQALRLGGRLDAVFDELVSQAAPRMRGARPVDEVLVVGPFPASAKHRWTSNLVLAGDAAGFFDGLTGEGISLALAGAKECASAVGAFLVDGDSAHFAVYDKALTTLQRPSTLMAKVCLALAARPNLGRRAIRNLSHKPQVFSKLVRISQGDLALSALRPSDALALACGL
jgi:menaquinone-9 beta-reductase